MNTLVALLACMCHVLVCERFGSGGPGVSFVSLSACVFAESCPQQGLS